MRGTIAGLLACVAGCSAPTRAIWADVPGDAGPVPGDASAPADGAAPVDAASAPDGAATDGGAAGGGNVSGSRLLAVYLSGADGTKQWIGWHDAQRNEDCSFQVAADGVTRCLPTNVGVVIGYYGDATCTKQLAQAACPVAEAVQRDPPTCVGGGGTHVFPIVGPFAGPTAYTMQSGACVAVAGVPSTAFVIGPETAVTEFVGALRVTE